MKFSLILKHSHQTENFFLYLLFLHLALLLTILIHFFSNFEFICFFFSYKKFSMKRFCLKKNTNLSISLIVGLEIIKTGRFGNNLIALIRAFQYCRIFHLQYLVIPDGFLFINESFSAKGIKIYPRSLKPNISKYLFKFSFYYKLPFCPIDIDFNNFKYLQDFIISRFRAQNLNKDDLYIHIRSGDVFLKNPNRFLGQPPLSFYLDIINFRKWNKINIIAENDFNPVIKELSKRGFKFSNDLLYEDISKLINAVNLVVGPGSFGQALVLLSKKLKNYFSFDYYFKYIHSTWESVYICEPDKMYLDKIYQKWENTNEQRRVLFISNCSRWNAHFRSLKMP